MKFSLEELHMEIKASIFLCDLLCKAWEKTSPLPLQVKKRADLHQERLASLCSLRGRLLMLFNSTNHVNFLNLPIEKVLNSLK